MLLTSRRCLDPFVILLLVMLAGYAVVDQLSVYGTMRPFRCPHPQCRSFEIITDVYGKAIKTKCHACGRWHEWREGVAIDVTNYGYRVSRLAAP